ncbi:uncharacterized protein TNCV_451431 [Trichonephila clavipes]|nr:uncharacterized protein TNCV_451431 [Trichonephila clavipes]
MWWAATAEATSAGGWTQGGPHSGAQLINPEFRVGSNFRILPGQHFSGMENVAEFLENFDNNSAYYEIPTQLACAYLKGHLTGRALDWFEVLGYRVVEDKVTDYAHLKQALTEQFPVVRNRSELETRFYASFQKNNQNPSDFVYDLLKIHKQLKLEMMNRQENWRETRGNNRYPDNSRSQGNSIDLRVKMLRIIRDSMVDAEVVNLIIDSIIKAVDRVVRGTVLSGVRMIKTDI